MAASNVVADPQGTLAPIVVDLVVPCPPDRAFHYFTHDIGRWWPLATHSLGEADAADVRFEPREGGRLIETRRDGREHTWGTVTTWQPGTSPGIQLAPRSRSRDRAVGRCPVRGGSRRHTRDAHARRLGAPRGRRHDSRELRGWLEVRARGAVWRDAHRKTRIPPRGEARHKTLDPRLRGDDAFARRWIPARVPRDGDDAVARRWIPASAGMTHSQDAGSPPSRG